MPEQQNTTMHRLSVQVRGIVQGVGFRPFAAGLCRRFQVSGAARNTPHGLDLEIQGAPRDLDLLLRELRERPPALARITSVSTSAIPIVPGESGFRILHSLCAGGAHTPVSPDAATCPDCLAELNDPRDRRHRYPFLNCTCCGPRFTITERVPYDRAHTTMKHFPMCPACEAEYNNPGDRRFHAQPTACPDCGPHLALCDARGAHIASSEHALDSAVSMLLHGGILAIKGLGGFHLACRAHDATAVCRLRQAKTREHKPFAVMARDTAQARTFCRITPHEERFLNDHTRPILLLDKIPDVLPRDTAPMRTTHGVMLPYTPLHHLLLADMDEPLIMTSANRGDEPIAFGDEDAFEQLSGIADAFLTHDRPIHMRCDDSVARVWRGRMRVLRRARGFAPAPLPLDAPRPILACGPDLKNTFALARNAECFVSHHIGDLHHPGCMASYEQAISHYENLFGFAPRAVACDMHPDYHSTAYAHARARDIPIVAVQHHHAHIAACLADNGERGPVIGVALDGAGYGPDNTVWGGEFLIADLSGFTRAAHLACAPMPGGDAAARQPWRMAASHLLRALGPDFTKRRLAFNDQLDPTEWNMLQQMIERGLNTPLTSSMGRLFDAVSALCGFAREINYEGQAAIELETLCRDISAAAPYEFGFIQSNNTRDPLLLDPAPVIRAIVTDLECGAPAQTISARFHAGVAHMIARTCDTLRSRCGLDTVALSGGVFQNWTLLDCAATLLEERGFRVLAHEHAPPNDGGVSLGQAAVAAAILGNTK